MRKGQCFVRLCKKVLDLTEIVKCELRRQPNTRHCTEIKCITSE